MRVDELACHKSYMEIYECLLKVNTLNSYKYNASAKLRRILDEIIEEDSMNIYSLEVLKVQEYLNHNKTCEVPYEPDDMWDVVLENGLMNTVTTQLLIEDFGGCEYALDEFKTTLYTAMHREVYDLYKSIERNLDNIERSRR